MGKRHPHFPAWQWRVAPHNGRRSGYQVSQLMAVPLFIVASLLMVSGVFSQSLADVAIGLIGVVAAFQLQRHDHPQP